MSNETTYSMLDATIVDFLLKGKNVVVPGLGYLELKALGDRRTVLFKPAKSGDASVQPASGNPAADDLVSVLYDTISAPLLKGEPVNLSGLGVFHPLKNGDGSLRVSFVPSAGLRRQLNGEAAAGSAAENSALKDFNALKDAENAEIAENAESLETPEKEPLLPVLVEELQKPLPEEKPEVKETAAARQAAIEKSVLAEIIKPEAGKVPERTGEPAAQEAAASKPKQIHIARKGDVIIPQDSRYGEGKKKKSSSREWIAIGIAALLILATALFLIIQNGSEKGTALKSAPIESHSLNLTDLASEHYGNPVFWVYIYEANRGKLVSPVNIPEDVQLFIPDLGDYGVDVTDSMDIQKAQVLSKRILSGRGGK